VISTEAWHSVVDFVTKILLLMLVLSATSRGANWIRLNLNVSIDIRIKLDIHDVPFVSNRLLSITKVLQGANDFSIEGWVEVIVSIFGFVLVFVTGGTDHELLTNNTFSCLK